MCVPQRIDDLKWRVGENVNTVWVEFHAYVSVCVCGERCVGGWPEAVSILHPTRLQTQPHVYGSSPLRGSTRISLAMMYGKPVFSPHTCVCIFCLTSYDVSGTDCKNGHVMSLNS